MKFLNVILKIPFFKNILLHYNLQKNTYIVYFKTPTNFIIYTHKKNVCVWAGLRENSAKCSYQISCVESKTNECVYTGIGFLSYQFSFC